MKQVTKKWGGAALLVLLFTATSTFAQTKRYIDPVNGSGGGDCTFSAPCTIARAFVHAQSHNNDTHLIQVRRAGRTVTVGAPDALLNRTTTFGVYARGSDVEVEGTIKFTGEFKVGGSGQFRLHEKASVEFEDFTAGAQYPIYWDPDPWERISITGTFKTNRSPGVFLDRLVANKSFTIDGGYALTINNGVVVKSGAVVTMKGANMIVLLNKGASATDAKGILRVDGEIKDRWIYLAEISVAAYGGGGDRFIPTDKYKPDANGAVDHEDCFRILGSGKISSDLRTNGAGNVCVELKQVGNILVGGSVGNGESSRQGRAISTDLIFRKDVVVDGDLLQFNDSRVVFEKTATVKGNVILQDVTPVPTFGTYYGSPRAFDAQVRIGVRNGPFVKGSKEKLTCAYITKRAGKKQRGAHIPGVQFEDAVTIEGDLDVRSDKIVEQTFHATDSTMTRCAPRVLFMAPLTKKTVTSRIGGDLVIEDDEDFNNDEDYSDGGRVRLTSYVVGKTVNSTHNVQIDGDIIAGGTTLGMEYASGSRDTGMCGATGSTPGNRIILSDKKAHVISGGLTLGALEINEELTIQNGPLTVKHVHVGSGGELKSDGDVKLDSGSLVLEGAGLQGTLADGSVITHLTYGSGDTDTMNPGGTLEALTILAGSGEVRLDQVTKTKNLGLCSGTLVLREAGTDKDSTLTVHDQITVQNGKIQKDTNRPGSIATDKAASPSEADRYILKYITPGKRTVTNALEWFDPRDVIVDHKSAEITVTGDRSLMGKLTVENGKLIVDGDLTVGTSPLHRTGSAARTNAGKYSLLLSNASELHTKEDNVVVNGGITLNGTSKLMTDGGDVHMLGRVEKGKYDQSTAQMSVAKDASIDLGGGTLMLGPEMTAKQNVQGGSPIVRLTLHGTLKGNILVPKGSKETEINVETIADARKVLGVITFDGTRSPQVSSGNNASGTLKLKGVDDKAKTLVIDSLSTMQGSVETRGKKVEFTKDVHLSSTTLSLYNDSTAFKGDLKVSGTGGLNTTVNSNTAKRSVLIDGSFMQTKGTKTALSGVRLHPGTTKIVEGDFMVSDSTAAYETKKATMLILKGDVHYMEDTLNAKVEFKGEEAQEVKTGMKTELDSVVVDNAKGLKLASSVMQKEDATLTLRRGRIMNADTMATAEIYTWTVKNPQIEENLKGRTSALEAKKCGADEDEACKFSISRGSLQSHASVSFARHLEQGNSGDGAISGGYLFPVGNTEGKSAYYRPLMLQLPFDLSEAEAATVSVMTDSEERLGAPLTVPGTSGQSLTLDVHSDMFWKIEMDETLESEVNVRIVAAGIQNVSDVSGLRIVQWDCEWGNPKLAGRYNATSAAGSFGVNDLLNGVVNLTQERITLETCTILGIAANGVENPINLGDLSGGRARLQFIHNLPLPAPVDLHLGDLRISSSLQFRDATAYRTFGAGSGYVLTIRPDGAPAEQAIKVPLPTLRDNRNYVAIAHGSIADPKALFMETRLSSSVTNKVDAILVHGSDGLGAVDVRVLDASDNSTPLMTLADNIPLNGKTSYLSLDASMHNVQVSSPNNEEEYEVYRMDLSGYRNETLVLNLSGSREDLRILGVDKNGMTFLPDVITGVETERAELPTEFALHGNYPNPFNPSTRIQFDLPETAQVRVQIVDMLGREVMSLPAQEFEAGANRSMEIHAMNLASGTYLYRMIATGAESRHVKTGRMTLVK